MFLAGGIFLFLKIFHRPKLICEIPRLVSQNKKVAVGYLGNIKSILEGKNDKWDTTMSISK